MIYKMIPIASFKARIDLYYNLPVPNGTFGRGCRAGDGLCGGPARRLGDCVVIKEMPILSF